MAVHMEGRNPGDDLGAYASWFARGYENKPAPMPSFIIEKEGNVRNDKSKVIPISDSSDNKARNMCFWTKTIVLLILP